MSDWEVEHMKAMDKKIQALRDEVEKIKAQRDAHLKYIMTGELHKDTVILHGAGLEAVQFWIEKAASKYDLNSEGGTLKVALKALSISAPKPGSGGCGAEGDERCHTCGGLDEVCSKCGGKDDGKSSCPNCGNRAINSPCPCPTCHPDPDEPTCGTCGDTKTDPSGVFLHCTKCCPGDVCPTCTVTP